MQAHIIKSSIAILLGVALGAQSWAQQTGPVIPELPRLQPANQEQAPPRLAPSELMQVERQTNEFVADPETLAELQALETSGIAIESEDSIRTALPIISTDVIAPNSINVGEESKIRIVLSNYGQETVNNLKLLVSLPGHLKINRTQPAIVGNLGGQQQFLIDAIAPDAKHEIELVVTPTDKKPVSVDTEVLIASRNRIEMAVRQAELSMVSSTPSEVVVGRTLQHQITVTNTGDGGASDVEVELNLPATMELASQQRKTIQIGYLPAGESRTLTVDCKPMVSGQTRFSYEARGRHLEPVSLQRSAFIARPELFVEAQGPKVNLVNREGIYSIQVKNPSDVTITNTKVLVELPVGMTITTISRSGDINTLARTATWTIEHMIPGQTELIQFKAVLAQEGPQSCQLTIQSTETEANQFALNTVAHSTADLAINVVNVTGPVRTGDQAQFEIAISNTGTRAANGVKIAVQLPEFLVAQQGEGYRYDATTQSLVFDTTDLDVSDKKSLKFNVLCQQGGNYVVRTTLSHDTYPRPLISEASLFVFDKEREKVGGSIAPGRVRR